MDWCCCLKQGASISIQNINCKFTCCSTKDNVDNREVPKVNLLRSKTSSRLRQCARFILCRQKETQEDYNTTSREVSTESRHIHATSSGKKEVSKEEDISKISGSHLAK